MNNQMALLLSNKTVQKLILKTLIDNYNTSAAAQKAVEESNINSKAFTAKGKKIIKDPIEVNEDFLKSFRALWPKEKNSTPSTIKACYIRYITNHPDHTEDQILKATQRWVKDKGDFCGEAHYFFEKQLLLESKI